jgi:translocation and assembly module TamB
MSPGARILRNAAIGLAALIVVVVTAALVVVRTDWFRDFTRREIVSALEDGTGGRVEMGGFTLDASHLRARAQNLVVHGKEPMGADPFVRVRQIELGMRMFGPIMGMAGVTYLGIEQPEVNVMVFPDGSTNIPSPKPSAPSKNTPLETVVDLAVGRFELRNGTLTFNSRRQPLDLRANNLHAQLQYQRQQASYLGQLSLEPTYFISGRNTPVTLRVTVPVMLERDAVKIQNATIATETSGIQIDGALENLRRPEVMAHVRGRVMMADLKNVADLPLETGVRGVPAAIDLEANAVGSQDHIQVTTLKLGVGQSHLDARGVLKDAQGKGSLKFDGELKLAELGRLAQSKARLKGTVKLSGEATMDASNRYQISGHLDTTEGLAADQGGLQIHEVSLSTGVRMTPNWLQLNGLRLTAFRGTLMGDASLENFELFRIKGELRRFDVQQALAALAGQKAPYGGAVSGTIQANGNLKAPGTRRIQAQARLGIAPTGQGIPLRGRLDADYNGQTDDVTIRDSYLALPHTRLTLSGSLQNRLNVSLVSHDARDLTAMAPGTPLVGLAGGEAGFTGTVRGGFGSVHVRGHLAASHFQVDGRQFDELDADLAANRDHAAVENGLLARSGMKTQFAAAVGLRNWSPIQASRISADATVQNGNLPDIMAIAGQPGSDYSGVLNAKLHLAGTVGNPIGAAALAVTNGSVRSEPFELDAQVSLADRLATIPSATIISPSGRIDLSVEFQHPSDSFVSGRIHASLRSSPIDLARVQTLADDAPEGQVQVSADVTGDIARQSGQLEFLPANIRAEGSARALRFQGQACGDAQVHINTAGQMVNFDLTSDFAGSNMRVQGAMQLVRGYPTTASAQVSGLAIERVLRLAHRQDIPARGNLTVTAHVRGTLQNPEGDARLTLARAVVFNEPIERMDAQVSYLAQRIDLPRLEIASGPSRIALSGRFDHPAGHLDAGKVEFRLENSRLDLARLKNVQKMRPGLAGVLEMAANGSAELRKGEPRVLLSDLNANLTAANLAVGGKKQGNLALFAHTTGGDRLDFKLDSDLAGASIQALGNARLAADYPVDAQLSFRNVTWTRVESLLHESTERASFEATTEGRVTVRGPLLRTERLQGSVEVARLEVQTLPQQGGKPITIENRGPVSATLAQGVVRLDRFHFTGPKIDIQASGTIPLQGENLKLAVNAAADLGVLQNFSKEISSSGRIVLAADVGGTGANPSANGSLELDNATVNSTTMPNGISNATGVVQLRGTRALVQNLTAESGGGKITLNGFASYAGMLRFAVNAHAEHVRVRVQEGVSVNVGADLRVAGSANGSSATGTVTLDELSYAPHTDLASMLTRATPTASPANPSAIAQNMKLDVQVRTSPAMRVQASLAQNVQTNADLRIRGTAERPSVLGRVNLTQGQLVFFGTTYTINTGNIAFYNPVRIEPILNLSLGTKTKGVDVVVNVSGPVDDMKLTYASDPPLQFQEIVALLSTGKTPTSDPTLLANQPTPPPQSLEQRGESAIVSQAVANPVAQRLQRVFGVSQLKIDPTFAGASQLPTAQLTLQQQITPRLTFTYASQLDNPNSTMIRADWVLNPQWSAEATRDQNGIVIVSLLYKKQFR